MEKQNTFAHLLYLAAVTHLNYSALFHKDVHACYLWNHNIICQECDSVSWKWVESNW